MKKKIYAWVLIAWSLLVGWCVNNEVPAAPEKMSDDAKTAPAEEISVDTNEVIKKNWEIDSMKVEWNVEVKMEQEIKEWLKDENTWKAVEKAEDEWHTAWASAAKESFSE